MFRLFIICNFISCIYVKACDDLPNLCIEEKEGIHLSKFHERYGSVERIGLLPKTEANMKIVYDKCWRDNYFYSDSICEIESELRARLKDKNTEHVFHYIDVMWQSMRLFNNHHDKEFSAAFFNDFFKDVNCFVLSLERTLKRKHNSINKSDLIYVVKSISDMQDEFIGYDREPGSFFNLYKQLHLTGEYWQSEEGQNMINAVTGALSEGFSLK